MFTVGCVALKWKWFGGPDSRVTQKQNRFMSTQSIQSQDIKISEVFQGFYSVPDYQREYVWQSKFGSMACEIWNVPNPKWREALP
jgi:hypothetical protein